MNIVYLGSRYFKFRRDISQTPWLIDNKLMTPYSLSGIIELGIKKSLSLKDFNFVSAGREDSNVRMLGNGRPFYVELKFTSSLETLDLNRITSDINSIYPEGVKIDPLFYIKKEECELIKSGEEFKEKTYTALIWSSKEKLTDGEIIKINSLGSIALNQKTPIRVIHRRSALDRPKLIHNLNIKYIEKHLYQLNLKTEAGTYIKEFIHGDLMRTQPSLSDLLEVEHAYFDCLELDVINVDLTWPPVKAYN